MEDQPVLRGHRVLVVEDEYYVAVDTARALTGAGAEVLGPCQNEDAARNEIEVQRPDAAVVDINLGHGPTFKLAGLLKRQGIPFVFVTGYDPDVIPAEFRDVERLQKPLVFRSVVKAVSRIIG